MTLMSDQIVDLHFVGAGAGTQCFPFYVYDEDGSNRRENITDLALETFGSALGTKVDKWRIFHFNLCLDTNPCRVVSLVHPFSSVPLSSSD